MNAGLNREQALKAVLEYNHDPFHIRHALTVESVMYWFAKDQGQEQDADFWALAGLLHDIDFERWPDEHCLKAEGLLRDIGATEDLIHAVCCHAYGFHPNLPEPQHLMEKILFAADELTGLIGAAALMRPSKSTLDMEVKSLKKKFKDKSFAAGCSRETISKGAEALGWELDTLLSKTLAAMQASEEQIAAEIAQLNASHAV